MSYEVCMDNTSFPPMYGIHGGHTAIKRISTDFIEVSRLAQMCVEGGLEEIHLRDVVEDFMRG